MRALQCAGRFFFTLNLQFELLDCHVKWAFSAPPVDRHHSVRSVCGKERYRRKSDAQLVLCKVSGQSMTTLEFFRGLYDNSRILVMVWVEASFCVLSLVPSYLRKDAHRQTDHLPFVRLEH